MSDSVKKTAGQILITSLTNISNDIIHLIKIFERFTDKQHDEDKDFYEFKVTAVKDLQDASENMKELIEKHDKLLETLNQIKFDMKEYGKTNDCDKCLLLKDKEKWIKRLWTAVIIFVGLLLTILGLKIAGIIQNLPGVF